MFILEVQYYYQSTLRLPKYLPTYPYGTVGFTIFSYIVALVQKCLYVHLNEFLHTAMIPFFGAKPTHTPRLVF
jgi:hypothetical protein